MLPSDITRLSPVDVMYVRESEKPSKQAFAELEAVVGVKGRRLYGVFDEGAGRYWACVQRREQDDPASLGLRMGTIEGELYASERLSGDHEAMVALIATPFEAMGLKHTVDSSRPSIEFNRRYDEVALYLTIVTIVESEGG